MIWSKKFIHLDMDAFFAAVEQRDNPELKGKIDQSYVNFSEGWLRGFEKKAEDIKSILASKLVKTAEEAEAILEKIAAEDPAAVMPEEAMPADGWIFLPSTAASRNWPVSSNPR